MSCFSVTDPFLTIFYYVEKRNVILRKNKGGGSWKNLYILLLWGGGSNPFLRNIFQVDIYIKIARSSGLAGIIFHLHLEGKKLIRMSCFLFVLLVLIYVKLGVLV